MATSEWGLCKDCKFWQIEPAATGANTTMGLCVYPSLKAVELRVSGNSGCNCFKPGKPVHAAGSSAIPHAAEAGQ